MGKRKTQDTIERERIVWIDRTFVREHSILWARPPFLAAGYAVLGLYIALMLLGIVAIFWDPIIIPVAIAIFIAGTVLNVDGFLADRRLSRLFRTLFERGGDVMPPPKRDWRKIWSAVSFAFMCFFFVLLIVAVINQWEDVPDAPLLLLVFMPLNLLSSAEYSNRLYVPLNPDEGMLFGGALFSYDTLRGFRSNSDGSGFTLTYDGREVAKGHMLAYDQNKLLDVLKSLEGEE
ncbi:MAG: hypothetical protein LBR72_06670 [Oscillospiraceae bacterium]|jgi:hypothetical protein|nr:hypothetical protein [Oscillospiraceae bacterium]